METNCIVYTVMLCIFVIESAIKTWLLFFLCFFLKCLTADNFQSPLLSFSFCLIFGKTDRTASMLSLLARAGSSSDGGRDSCRGEPSVPAPP